jgi:hypothetical protein
MKLRPFILLLSVLLLILLINKIWSGLKRNTLAFADKTELRETYNRWREAGRPQGVALEGFLKGRRRDLVICTQVFTLGNTSYVGLFALTNSTAGYFGTLIITTNTVLLWQEQNGKLSLTDYRP